MYKINQYPLAGLSLQLLRFVVATALLITKGHKATGGAKEQRDLSKR
jgi:hypothetical protein